MKVKIILVAVFLSLAFWGGISILSNRIEGNKEVIQKESLIAQVVQQDEEEVVVEDVEEPAEVEEVEDLTIRAKAAISFEVNGRGVLFEKQAQSPLPIASITKLVTALVIYSHSDIYNNLQLIPITEDAVAQEGTSKYGKLEEGELFSVKNLLYTMLIESSNDAAYAFADFLGHEEFVALMNGEIKKIGLKNTGFVNPSGLESNELRGIKNYSTAEELVELSKYILNNYPEIFTITKTNSYNVLNPNGSLHHYIPRSTNILLTENNPWRDRIIGGKTGWHIVSRGCLILILEGETKGTYIVNVVLGTEDRFGDMRRLIKITNQ